MSNPSMIGPSLPPHLVAARSGKSSDESKDEPVIGPSIGPQLPSTKEGVEFSSKTSYGPSLPPGMIYGPSIPKTGKYISAHVHLFGLILDMHSE